MNVVRITRSKARWSVGEDVVIGRIGDTKKLQAFAGRHGLKVADLITAALEATEEPPTEDVKAGFRVRVRRTFDPAEKQAVVVHPSPVKAFAEALKHHADEYSIISWLGTDELAVLDVDYHGTRRPVGNHVQVIGLSLRPIPEYWWQSHGGGLHAVYRRAGTLRADEVAAAGALSVLDLCPAATVEILSSTTHPLCPREKGGETQRAGKIHVQAQDTSGMLAAWRGSDDADDVPEEDIDRWLESRGMDRGGRHPHDLCPYDPCPATGADPVTVTEDGVLCFRCKGTGHRSGGFAPWSALVNGRTIPRILEAARNWVPWEHARFIVGEDYGERAGPDVLAKAYVSLASIIHDSEDPRIPRLRENFRCVRGDSGVWLDSESLNPIQPAPSKDRLRALPSTRRAWLDPEEGWKETVDPILLDVHATDQIIPGCPEILAVRGVKLWGQYLPYGDRSKVRAVVVPLEARKHPPQYLPAGARVSEAECDEVLERCFPGIDLNYLKLLVVARGFGESGIGMVPLILVSGPTGSGKTNTAELAATILGDRCVTVPRGNYQETLGYRIREGGIVVLDEFGKGLAGNQVRELFDFLLEVKRNFSYRRLYAGPVTDFVTTPLVVTNNSYGSEVICHEQVARRAVWVRLSNTAPRDWQETCGTADLRLWRNEAEYARVADSYLSHLCDEFFIDAAGALNGGVTFFGAAEALGYFRVRDSDAREEMEGLAGADQVETFFNLLCLADDADGGKYSGRGWKELNLADVSDECVRAWKELSNEDHSDAIAIKEHDLNVALGVPLEAGSVKFLCRKVGLKVFAKFQLDLPGGGRHNYVSNEGILAWKR